MRCNIYNFSMLFNVRSNDIETSWTVGTGRRITDCIVESGLSSFQECISQIEYDSEMTLELDGFCDQEYACWECDEYGRARIQCIDLGVNKVLEKTEVPYLQSEFI